MKTISTFLFFTFALSSMAQEIPQFELTKDGVKPLVIELNNLNSISIFKMVTYWSSEYNRSVMPSLNNGNSPALKLMGSIENESIMLDGFMPDAWSNKYLGMKEVYDMDYSLKIDIKDNKMRVDFIINKLYKGLATNSYNFKSWFKSNGEVSNSDKSAKSSLEASMNKLLTEIVNYVKGPEKKSDW